MSLPVSAHGGKQTRDAGRPAPDGDRTQKRLPFGTDIWTTTPSADATPRVHISIYGGKSARLFAGEPEYDFLWLQVGDHVLLEGATHSWEEFAEVLNEALRQRRVYRERIDDRRASGAGPEAER